MEKRCLNRLTVLGPKEPVQRFLRSGWEKRVRGRYFELLETMPRRFGCLFETDEPPMDPIRRLSRRRPELVLILEYEVESQRVKGLVKAQGGKIALCAVEF
jgi:hypothetical protein